MFRLCGIHRVDLTGGEPLIRPDFPELTGALTEKGLYIGTLYTGSFYGPDPTRCEFFKNGFRQKIIDLGDSLGWKRVLRGE